MIRIAKLSTRRCGVNQSGAPSSVLVSKSSPRQKQETTIVAAVDPCPATPLPALTQRGRSSTHVSARIERVHRSISSSARECEHRTDHVQESPPPVFPKLLRRRDRASCAHLAAGHGHMGPLSGAGVLASALRLCAALEPPRERVVPVAGRAEREHSNTAGAPAPGRRRGQRASRFAGFGVDGVSFTVTQPLGLS
jgi:hypothetical protein